MKELLTEYEKKELIKFISNKPLVEAVKKFLLNDIYGAGVVEKGKPAEPRKNWVYGLMMDGAGQDYKITNEELGEKVRTVVEGTRALELALIQMEKLIEPEPKETEDKNEAR